MPIAFRCPKCRNKLSTAKRKAGTLVGCPGCGVDVRVPSADRLDPQVERLLATAGARAGGDGEAAMPEAEDDPPPAPLPPPVPMARRPKPAPPSPAKWTDLTLFEREDFAEMLEKGADSDADETPLPLPPAPAATAQADGFVVTRGTAIMVLVSVVVLLGLAFAAGFLVGNRG